MLARRTEDCFFAKPCPGRDVRDTTMSNIWVMNADRSDVTSHHQTHRWGGARPLTLMTADDLCGPYKRPAQRESNGIPDLRNSEFHLLLNRRRVRLHTKIMRSFYRR